MRILITIPHYWKPSAVVGAGSGSTGPDPEPRVLALTACLNALRQNFGCGQYLCGNAGFGELANVPHTHEITAIICTLTEEHVLGRLPITMWPDPTGTIPAGPFELVHRWSFRGDPQWLHFWCQRELACRLEQKYDYYCLMEDDLIVRDPWFFGRLAWFNRMITTYAFPEAILQPRRYEAKPVGAVHKLYIDGALSLEQTRTLQDVSVDPAIVVPGVGEYGTTLGEPRFERCLNPHSGCFFLTRAQMQKWADTDYFKADMRNLSEGREPDRSFIGPLESGCTLGIMKTFRVYKPAPECANFFEIEHYGTKYLDEFVRNMKSA